MTFDFECNCAISFLGFKTRVVLTYKIIYTDRGEEF